VNIIFNGQGTDVLDRFRKQAAAKLSRIERLEQKAIRVHVEVSTERNPRQSGRRERVELTIFSRGPAIRAEASAEDRYAALDMAFSKLESRLRRSGDRRKCRHAAHATRLDARNALSLIGGYDLVLDGSDNFETRYLVSDACFLAGKPLITAALGMFDGSLTTIRAHERNAEGEFNPTYRCLFPEPPPAGTVPACAEAGVLGALAGVLGSMMALEAIREIVGFGEGLVGRLLMVDARAMRFETLRYRRDPLNPLNGDALVITDLSGHR